MRARARNNNERTNERNDASVPRPSPRVSPRLRPLVHLPPSAMNVFPSPFGTGSATLHGKVALVLSPRARPPWNRRRRPCPSIDPLPFGSARWARTSATTRTVSPTANRAMMTERRDADVVVADGTTRGRERVDEIARMGRVGRSAGKGEDRGGEGRGGGNGRIDGNGT